MLVIEASLAAAWGLRLRKGVAELRSVVAAQVGPVGAEMARLRELAESRRRLSAPHRWVWHWYRHPLTEAYRESRRLRARRERAAG